METSYPTLEEPATVEYVLAVLQDEHRQLCQFDIEAERSISITFDATVADWRLACDLLDWRPLGRALNAAWTIDVTDLEWESVMEPEEVRTLRDVCGLIASRASRRRVRPAVLLGKPCLPAGAFLSIRSMLADAGEDVGPIAPSTPLAEYARRHLPVFLYQIPRLAPGVMPLVSITSPAYDSALRTFALSLLFVPVRGVLGQWLGWEWALPSALVVCALAYFALQRTAKQHPAIVEFGELRTFGDLATLIALGSARNQCY